MLQRFFRINDPYRLLGLLFIIVLASLPLLVNPMGATLGELKGMVIGEAIHEGKLMYIQLYDDTAPLASAIFGLLDALFGRSLLARHLLGLFLIFFQSSFFAVLLINNKAYTENNYLPGLIFAVLCFFSFDILSASPEMLAATILLLALNNLFKEIEFRIQRDEIVLNLGVYLGLTTFLVFSYWIFLPGTLAIMIMFTRATARKISLLLFGFLLPHALLIALYYYWDAVPQLISHYYVPNLTFASESLISWRGIFTLSSIPLAYLVFSIFMLNRKARLTKYQSQLMQVMFLWLILALLHAIIAREFTPLSFVTFVPPMAYFIGHYLLLIRRRWITETMLWAFIGGVMLISTLGRYSKLSNVDYTGIFPIHQPEEINVKNRRVMQLAPGWSVYQNNQLGGYFANWNVSQTVFKQLDLYDNIEIIADAFERDPPDVILDPNQYMLEVFKRVPYLKKRYSAQGNVYERVSN